MIRFVDYLRLLEVQLQQVQLNALVPYVTNYLKGLTNQKQFAAGVSDAITKHFGASDALQQMMTSNPQQWRQSVQAYDEAVRQLEAAMSAAGWKPTNSGAWVEFYRNGVTSGTKVDNKTFKRYVTIDHNDMWKMIQTLPALARNLSGVQTSSGQEMIGFKIPQKYSMYVGHKDHIVIHYYDPNAKQQIDQAVDNYIGQSGIKTIDRASMGRDMHGVDISGQGSDSEILAQHFVRNVDANRQALVSQMSNPPAVFSFYPANCQFSHDSGPAQTLN